MDDQDEVQKSYISSKHLIRVAGILTIVIVSLFVWLAVEKELLSMSLNEIGDSFAGFAGFLAFLWIIVTVLLQSNELRLQRHEIRGMRESSDSQAESLRASQRVQELTLLRTRASDMNAQLSEISEVLSGFVIEFIEIHCEFDYPQSYRKRQTEGVNLIINYFLKKDLDSSTIPSDMASLGVEHLRSDFSYEAFLLVNSIVNTGNSAWIMVRPFYKDADLSELTDHVDSWLSGFDIRWFGRAYPYLIHLEKLLRLKLKEGASQLPDENMRFWFELNDSEQLFDSAQPSDMPFNYGVPRKDAVFE